MSVLTPKPINKSDSSLSRLLKRKVYRSAILPYLFTTIFLLLPIIANGQETATLRVMITSEEDGNPVLGANLILKSPDEDTLQVGTSDTDGFFEFSNIEAREYRLTISYIGFQTHREQVNLEPGETKLVNTALSVSTEMLDEVRIQVAGGAARREAGRQTITAEELGRIPTPGPGGDLTMYLQTQPGVVTTGDRGGDLHIRGGTPAQNLILVDNMPIIKPFHISNLFSAFPQATINSVDIYAGGFGAEYIGATSSVLDVTLRPGNMREYQSQVASSPYMLSFQAEGPLRQDDQSLMIMGRRSIIEHTGPVFSGEEVPLDFYDMIGRYSIQRPGISCSMTAIHTYDEGQINPHRQIMLDWTNSVVGGRCLGYSEQFDNTFDVTIGYTNYSSSEGGIDQNIRTAGIQKGYLRLDLEQDFWGLPLDYGFSWELTRILADLDDPFAEVQEDAGMRFSTLTASIDEYISSLKLYATVNWNPNEYFTVKPGLAYQIKQSELNASFEPRLRVNWKPDGTERREITLAAGRYHQMLEGITDERDAGTVFYVWTPTRHGEPLPRSLHGILGYRRDFGIGLEYNIEAYAKDHKSIPVSEWTREPGNTIRTAYADGFTYGADVRFEVDRYPFYALMSYGIAEVTYEATAEDLVAWIDQSVFSFNPAHDRRHQFNLIGSYQLGDFTASINWQYASGRPFTQVYAYNIALNNLPFQNPVEVPGRPQTLYSEPYDARLPGYHRLDIAIERKFIISPWLTVETEIGAINSYNSRNIFYFDVNTLQRVDQMPFLPYFSLKADIN